MMERFENLAEDVAVRGWWHEAARGSGDGILLTHGAGANCESKLLVAVAEAFEGAGFVVLRFDLPFRQERRYGPPRFGNAARDRDGIRRAIEVVKEKVRGRIFAGGHSYGGRQASMLVADEPELADGLLLLSYPLHPPKKPEQVRTAHFPKLRRAAFFVHGARDPFASSEEMEAAVESIRAPHEIMEIEGGGHDLIGKGAADELAERIVAEFREFVGAERG
jgi:uncharacterized protein